MVQAMSLGKTRMDALRDEIGRGMTEEQGLLRMRNQQEFDQKNYEILFAVSVALLALACFWSLPAFWCATMCASPRPSACARGEAEVLQATLDNVRDGVAYFAADGRLSAFNRQFFRLLDFPDALANDRTTLSELARFEKDRPRAILVPPRPGEAVGDPIRVSWGGRELEVYRALLAAGGFLIGVAGHHRAHQGRKHGAPGAEDGSHRPFDRRRGARLQQSACRSSAPISISRRQARRSRPIPRWRERLENAMVAVSRGSRLISQLLAFARRQPLEPRSVNLGRVIGDMTDLLRRTLGDNIEVEAVVAGGLWNTLADPNQVETTILNLAINARDAMPDGGKLTLEAANAYLDDSYAANHEDVVPGQYVMLAVSDTGNGMSPEVIAPCVRALLHHQAGRQGHGTGAGAGLWLRQADRRPYQDL